MLGRNVTLAWLACQQQHNTRDRKAWLVSVAPGESIAAGEERWAISLFSGQTESCSVIEDMEEDNEEKAEDQLDNQLW